MILSKTQGPPWRLKIYPQSYFQILQPVPTGVPEAHIQEKVPADGKEIITQGVVIAYIYTFHLGMFRKSFATPTRKDVGAGGAVWTDIATHVFNNTKHLFKLSMIKRF